MKNLAIILVSCFFILFSCKKESSLNDNQLVNKVTQTKVINDLKFKLLPTGSNQFTFSVYNPNNKDYVLLIKKDTIELASFPFKDSEASVKFDFLKNQPYDLIIRSSQENTDTIFQEDFIIPGYIHNYSNKFNYEKLVSFNVRVDFDMSPSRNMIYYIDEHGQYPVFLLKRLSIADKKIDVIDANFFSTKVRCKNDSQLIVPDKDYNNRFLGTDSCALLNYDVNTHKTSFIDWCSSNPNGWGGYSRVLQNSILVPNPEISNTVSLINLSDNSKITYTGDTKSIGEGYNRIGWNGKVLNFSTNSFEKQLPFLNEKTHVEYFDEKSGYYVAVEYSRDAENETYSRMIIYKDLKIVYEQPFEKGRVFDFPNDNNLEDNKLIFSQTYNYDSVVRFSGYYVLDITTKEITFLQSDNDVPRCDFMSKDKKSIISIGYFEIYKITME